MRYILASGVLFSGSLFAASLTGVEHGINPAGNFQIVFKGVRAVPNTFNIDSPASIVLDFDEVDSALRTREVDVNRSGVYDIDVITGSNKTRAVVNLATPMVYSVSLSGGDAVLTLVGKNVLARGGSANASAGYSLATPTAKPKQVQVIKLQQPQQAHIKPSIKFTTKQAESVRSLAPLFRKNLAGNGIIDLTLPSDETEVDINSQGNTIIAEIAGFRIDNQEQKRLDVRDYSTPVDFADIQRSSKGSKVTLDMGNNPFEYTTRQSGNIFTIEVISPDLDDSTRQLRGVQGFSAAQTYTGESLSLNFQDIEVRAVLQIIAEFTKNNVVVSDSVSGNITLRLDNVPWDQALDIILKTKGLDKRQSGNVIYIAPTAELYQSEIELLEGQQDKEKLMPSQTELIQVRYARAEDLRTIIEQSRDTAAGGGESREDAILSNRGRISIDPRTNTLLVSDIPVKIRAVRELIAKLDKPVRQVLVDARLVLTTDQFSRNLGVRLGATFADINAEGRGVVGSGSLAGADAMAAGVIASRAGGGGGLTAPGLNNRLGVDLPSAGRSGSYGLAILGSDWLVDLELSALQTEGRIEIVSSPRVVTQDGSQANVASGEQIPQFVSSGQGSSVSYQSAELSLDVTPRIAPDDMVDMELVVTNNAPGKTYSIGGSTVSAIDTNTLNTNVLVDNGETIVLGGVYRQTQQLSQSKVPLLGDLPVVGAAFRNKSNTFNKTELLIFVTPRIIDKRLVENDKFSNLRD